MRPLQLTQELNELGIGVMDRQARFSGLWTATGFANVETMALVIPMEFSSFEDLWRIESNAQGPPKLYISSLSEDRRQLLKERLRTDLLGNRPDGSITLRAKAWVVRAVVPAG